MSKGHPPSPHVKRRTITPHTLKLTTPELINLARLVGHHVTGDGFERVYDELSKLLLDVDINARSLKELPASESAFYGTRPMVEVKKG